MSSDFRAGLFEKNLAILAQHGVVLPPYINEFVLDDFPRIVGSIENKDLNIKLDSGFFYAQDDALSFVQKQCDEFLEKPKRMEVVYLNKHPRQGLTTVDSLNRVIDYVEQNNILLDSKLSNRDLEGEYLIVLGLGLGLHVPILIEKLPCLEVILVEPDFGLLFLSLHCTDFEPVITELERRHGKLQIFHHSDPAILIRDVKVGFERWNTPLCDGSYIFTHYNSHSISKIQKDFSVTLATHIGTPKGFFEDEELMLNNTVSNFLQYKYRLLQDPFAEMYHSLSHIPCCVVGSGPSLDGIIPYLKQQQDYAIIISCGTALRALLDNGIEPDFHCEIENTPGPANILRDTSEIHDLKQIHLIAACTVDPRISGLFKDVVFLMRDHLSCSYFFDKVTPTYMISPTVTNLGIRVAIGFGFDNIFLIGTDFGSRSRDIHHSRSSVYYRDKKFFEKNPGHRQAVTLKNVHDGNFGGTAMTNQNFLWASIFMGSLINDYLEAFPLSVVYNCSDGIVIPNAIPMLAHRIDFTKTQNPLLHKPKSELVRVLFSITSPSRDSDFEKIIADLEKLKVNISETNSEILELLSDKWQTRENILSSFHSLAEVFKQRIMRDSRFGNLVDCFYSGTIVALFSFALAFERRMPSEQKIAYREFIQNVAREGLSKNYNHVQALIDELISFSQNR